jgi:hypothetical protein
MTRYFQFFKYSLRVMEAIIKKLGNLSALVFRGILNFILILVGFSRGFIAGATCRAKEK